MKSICIYLTDVKINRNKKTTNPYTNPKNKNIGSRKIEGKHKGAIIDRIHYGLIGCTTETA